jgi:hypothetical protein
MRCTYGIPVENPEGRDHLGAMSIDRVIILMWIIKKQATGVDFIHVDEGRIHWWYFLCTVWTCGLYKRPESS